MTFEQDGKLIKVLEANHHKRRKHGYALSCVTYGLAQLLKQQCAQKLKLNKQ